MDYLFLGFLKCVFTITDWITGHGKRCKAFWVAIRSRQPLSDVEYVEQMGLAVESHDLVLWIRKVFAEQVLGIPSECLRPDDIFSDFTQHEGIWIMSIDDVIFPLERKLDVPLRSRVYEKLECDLDTNSNLTIGVITKCLILVVREVVPNQKEVEA